MKRAEKLIRIDPQVTRYIERKQKPRETYNQTLRRLLGLEERASAGARREGGGG